MTSRDDLAAAWVGDEPPPAAPPEERKNPLTSRSAGSSTRAAETALAVSPF